MKKLLFVGIVALILIAAWYLLSPLVRVGERDDPSPLGDAPRVGDTFDTMTPEEKGAFVEAVNEMRDMVVEMSEPMEGDAKIIAEGAFEPRAHSVEGRAFLIETAEGTILRFEDFETVNGPNLHIYLASTLGDDDYVDLGKIRATRGNVNYEIGPEIDTTKYNKVLVWCVPFRVLFSYAELR